MIPELAAVYSLSPDEVWEMSQSQYARFIEHHEQLMKEANRG
jgi:hypothetical protein